MTETLAQKRSGRKSRYDFIKREAVRRMEAGEPLNYRVLRAAVGGSHATIKRVFEDIGVATDPRGDVEREEYLRRNIRAQDMLLKEQEGYSAGLKDALATMSRTAEAAAALISDTRAPLMQAIDDLRRVAGQMASELKASKTQSDPLDAARIRRLSDENGRLSMRLESLMKTLQKHGIEPG